MPTVLNWPPPDAAVWTVTWLSCWLPTSTPAWPSPSRSGTTDSDTRLPRDLERAVALALQVQHVAEAVADQQVEQAGAAAGHHGQAGGLVADRQMLHVCRNVPSPLPR